MRSHEKDNRAPADKQRARDAMSAKNPLHRLTAEDQHIAKIAAWMIMRDGEEAASNMFARADALRRAGQSEDARMWQRVADACFACLHGERKH